LYAAQAIPLIDAEIAEKGHLWTETSLQLGSFGLKREGNAAVPFFKN
jgi:hypothetical protein